MFTFNFRHRFPVLATMAIIGLFSLPASADDKVHHQHLTLTSPWLRATPPGAAAGGGYLVITNAGTTGDTLVGAKTDGVARTEVHAMKMDGGVMKMRPLADGLDIPAGETVELKPGGFHLMFMDLEAGFVEGEERTITLSFRQAGPVAVTFPVMPIGAKSPETSHGDHSDHKHN